MSAQDVQVRITGQARDLQQAAQRGVQALANLDVTLKNLANTNTSYDHALNRVRDSQGRFIGGISQVRTAARELIAEEQRLVALSNTLKDSLTDQEFAALQASGALRGLGSNMGSLTNQAGTASFAVISLGQGFQDAGQFGMGMAQGIRAVTNNAQQAFQAFVLLRGQTDSMSGAFAAFRSAMMGPAGLLLAFGAITAAIEFYANMSQRAAKETTDLKNAMSSLLDVSDDIEKIEVNADTIRSAREEEEKRVAEMERALKLGLLEGDQRAVIGRLSANEVNALRAQGKTEREIADIGIAKLEVFKEQIAVRRNVLDGLIESELDIEQKLAIAQAARTNSTLESARINSLKNLGLEEEADLELSLLKKGRERFDLEAELSRIRANQTAELWAATEAAVDLVDNTEEIIAAVTKELSLYREITAEREYQLLLLKQQAADISLPDEQINVGARLETEADRAEKAVERLNLALSRQLGAGVADMIANFASAEGGIGSFGEQIKAGLGSLAVTLGKSMIQFGVAGIAIKRFISNPFAAIAAGTALVVMGSRLARSAQSQMDSFSESGGSGARTFAAPGTAGNGFGTSGSLTLAPASVLQQQAPVGGGGFNGRFVIEGRDLVSVVSSEADFQARTGVRNPVFSR